MVGKKNVVKKLAQVFNAQINPNEPNKYTWFNIKNALTKSDKTYATSYFMKKKYIKKYETHKVKDKKGKEIDSYKTPVYDYRYNHPYTATAHQFAFKVPNISQVKSITFNVRMKAQSGMTAKAPIGRFCIYGQAFDDRLTENKSEITGFHNGLYTIYKTENLKTTWYTHKYVMGEDKIKTAKLKASAYNASKMGIDLIFDDAKITQNIKGEGVIKKAVHIAYVEAVIEYYTPTYKISFEDSLQSLGAGFIFTNDGSEILDAGFTPKVYAGDEVTVTATFKKTINKTSKFDIKVAIPDSMEIVGTPKCKNSSFNKSTKIWKVDCSSNEPVTVTMRVKSHRSGINKVVFSNNTVGSFTYKFNVERGKWDGYEKLILTRDNDDAHKNHRFCIGLDANGYVENADEDGTPSDNETTMQYTIQFDKPVSGGYWSVPETGVGTVIEEQSPSAVLVDIPYGNFHAQVNYCFYPKSTGIYMATVTSELGDTKYLSFEVFSPYVYHLTSKKVTPTHTDMYYGIGTEMVTISDHRTVTDIDIDTSSIPSVVDSRDANMVQSKCTLVMHNQDELDYIGCVPLEHLHFDPKSTFKDTLLNNTYKNKKYMGKKLAPDEDITLNVRLHPQQVTTIQGLIEMDKPIPINANHRCFESDALNHRGWAEIYSIKAEETNPHWYKCDIDVKYLTHNLNTRFKIDKGVKVSKYSKPSLMAETVQSGSKLDGSSLEEDTTYFYVDTDGTYTYSTDVEQNYPFYDEWGKEVLAKGDNTTVRYTDDEGVVQTITGLNYVVEYIQNEEGAVVIDPVQDQPIEYKNVISVPDNQRNAFSIDEGQHIQVRTRESLSKQSVVSFEWLSTLQDEDKENNISRIIRLIDKKTGDIIFEYEYYDFVFDDDSISCETIARIKRDGEWVTENGSDVDMRVYTSLSSADEDDDSDDGDDNEIELLYGSTLRLTLDNKKLELVDEGFNSMEYSLDDIDLISGDYYWETYWVNNNQDGESEDVVCYFDIVIASTILKSQYADKYDKLYVSPFPVKEKNLLFTREAEEGTIYYFEDDRNEFSYVMNPYYQYHNGTDLVTNDGVSIFNLNYGYEIVYIQNGLVRLGFNRLNGNLYLGKYDTITRDYITTHRLHLKKYDDINVNSISDDKIEIQASDSIFTIWRGHPYIMVKHNNESIYIDSQFNRVWAEQVGDNNILEYPTNWMLLNDKNLLPPCVGGTDTMNTSCFDFPWGYDEYDEPLPNPNEIEVPNREDATVNLAGVLYKNQSDVTVKSNIEDVKFLTGTQYTFLIDGSATTQKDHIKLADFYHGNFGTYNTDITVNHNIVYGMSLFALKKTIQSSEANTLQAKVFDYGYDGIEGKIVHFFEVYEPELKLKGKSIIQSGDPSEIDAYLVDSQDGSIIREQGRTIHFYEKYTPKLELKGTPIIQADDPSSIDAYLVDADDGSIIREQGRTIHYYKRYEKNVFVDDCTGTNISYYYEVASGNPTYTTFNNYPVINTPAGASLDILSESDKFTIEFDLYPTDTWNWCRFYCLDSDKAQLGNKGAVISSSYDVTTSYLLYTKEIGYGSWKAIKMEVENGVGSIYVNGVLKSTSSVFDITGMKYLRIENSKNSYIKNVRFTEG